MRKLALVLTGIILCASASAPRKAAQKPLLPPGPALKWFQSLTLREKVAQLVMVQFYGDSPGSKTKAYRDYVALVRDLRVGGLIVLNRVQNGSVRRADPYETAAFLNRMQKLAKIPLIVGGDFERGASMRMTLTTPFPHLMAYGAANDLDSTWALGHTTAREARAMGVHWVFAPDADVNNNPENPIINIRSFSENPGVVSANVKAFIEGARAATQNRILVTAKHFPGHGDTDTDTHMGLGVVNGERERLEQVELAPFRAAIAAGVDSVMTSHLAVPAIEPEPIPATVSRNILTGLLREQLGFKGIIVTDAMDMQGLTKTFPAGEASVRAIEAGADLLLIPTNPQEAVRAVVAAVNSGRITQRRIDESVAKILAAKVQVGLQRQRLVNLEDISDEIDQPEDQEIARHVAEKALTLVKNDGDLLPLRNPSGACFFLMAAGRFSTQGRDLQDAIRQRAPSAQTILLDPLLPVSEFDEMSAIAGKCDSVVLAAYVTGSAYRGNIALAGRYPGFVEKVLATGRPVAFVALGNPYLLKSYPAVTAYLATYSTTLYSELGVAKAIFGEIEVDGKLPVTIPGQAEYGFGLKMAKLP
jgi:beta-N-acetylhexosaminidase